MTALYIILAGLCIASFIGSLAYRVPRGISIVKPPSFCPSCETRLGPADLVPVASFVALLGRCRHCGVRIPFQYLVVELCVPAVFFFLYRRFGISLLFLTYSYLCCVMFYLSLVDIDTAHVGIWDIGAVYLAAAAVVCLSAFGKTPHRSGWYLFGALAGAALVGVSYAVVFFVKKRIPMGGGDLLVVPALGLCTGLRGIVHVLIAGAALGTLLGVVLITVRAVKADRKFPMLPYLAFGIVIELLLFS
ncbi:MAG: prepilin peptidase [Spirochaetes bacterium]|nr:prepilin peptidase [Spirochaetota bacterium]